jgi:glycosyltransferase involved in cell wall biosynthesis
VAKSPISVIIPTLNESDNLPRTLSAIAQQDYPREQIEIFVTDGGSSDATLDIARSFAQTLPITIVDNSADREAEYGKALALEKASGELIQFMDADMWPSSTSLLRRLADPLVNDSALAGSTAPYRYARLLTLWNRYLSCDEFQRDPLLEALTPNMDDFVVERRDGYDVCSFPNPRIPPMGGTTMFRRSGIDLGRWDGHFREVDHPAFLVKKGANLFAYVRDVGWLHQHCTSLRDLVRKRVRNTTGLETSFLRIGEDRDFVWIDTSSRREVLRVGRWVIGTNLLIPRFVEGVRRAFQLRRWEPVLRPVVAVAITDAVLISLVRTNEGRALLRRTLDKIHR